MSAIRKLARLRQALKGVDIDDESGVLTAYGERFLLIPVKLIHSIEDRLTDNLGPVTATSFQYEIGRQGGRVYARLLDMAGYRRGDLGASQKAADQFGTLAGWGKIEVVESDSEKGIIRVRWRNGLSVRNKKGRTPVCHFVRGVMTGGAEEAWGRRCESVEILCEGKGDSYCEAVVGDPEEVARLAEASRH